MSNSISRSRTLAVPPSGGAAGWVLCAAAAMIGATARGQTALIEVVPVPGKDCYPPGTTIRYECNRGVNDGQPCATDAHCIGGICLGTLSAREGGFRAWFEFRVRDWDPDGDGIPPWPGTVQAKLDLSGLLDADTSDLGNSVTDDGDQPDLVLAAVPCTDDATCQAAFGEFWARCDLGLGMCQAVYADPAGAHPSSYCSARRDLKPAPR